MDRDVRSGAISRDLDCQLQMTHERFVTAMGDRLPAMPLEQKERYFALLSVLVAKLEDRAKPLQMVLRELVAEATPYVLSEMGNRPA